MWCLAGGVGPLLGGVFAQLLSWRWAFYINLPVCTLTFILLLLYLDVHNPRTRALDGLKAIDWAGSVSMLSITLMILIGLNFGGTIFAWSSPKVLVLIFVGAAMSVVFIFSEKRLAKYPLMPLSIFRDRSNVACLAVVFFHGIVFLGSEYYLPLFFQSARLASPLHSGMLILPFIVTEALGGIAAGVFVHQVGAYRPPIWVGTALLTVGMGTYITLGPRTSLAQVVGVQILAGFGAGFVFSPPMVALQARVAQHDVATATATMGSVRNVACAISVVVGGVVFSNSITGQRTVLESASLNSSLVDVFAGKDAVANVLSITNVTDIGQRLVVQGAYASSLRNCWIMYTAVAGAGVLAAAFVRTGVLSEEHVETKTGLREKDETRQTA
jgi:MFS family permease